MFGWVGEWVNEWVNEWAVDDESGFLLNMSLRLADGTFTIIQRITLGHLAVIVHNESAKITHFPASCEVFFYFGLT